MTEHRAERPPLLVTVCIYLGAIGAFHVVRSAFILTDWYSTEGQERIAQFTDPMVKDGVDRGDAEMIFRVYLGIFAFLGASVVIFAIYTAMGHAVSRIMLTITGPLLALLWFLQLSIAAIFVGVMASFCVLQLWKPDVRTWFALLSGKEQPVPVAASGWPPPMPPVPPEQSQHPVPPQQWTPHPQAYFPPPPPAPVDVVKILSLIALIVSAVVAAGCGFFLLVYGVAREELEKEMLNPDNNWMNLTEAEIRANVHDLAVASWVVLPLCVVAMGVSAVLLWRRRRRN
jgi:hypothetical protein